MSGRNGRIVRNRESNSKFNLTKTKIIIIAIIVLIIVLSLIVTIILKLNNKSTIKIADINEDVNYEYFILSSNDALGVIDNKGKILIKQEYSDIFIPNPSKDVFICYDSDGNSKVFDKKGKEIFTQYNNIQPINNQANNYTEQYLLKYEQDGLLGIINLEGNIVTQPMYDEIYSLDSRPGRVVVKKDNKCGLMDNQGNLFIDMKYDQISADNYSSPEDDYEKTGYVVGKKDKDGINYGYIDYKGNILLDNKYETIERALEYEDKNIYLIVMQRGKKGVLKNKKKIIDLKYQEINYANSSDIFILNKNGKYGFSNLEGNTILEPQYDKYSIAGNYISVSKEDENQLFDVNGNLVNTASYTKMIETKNPSYFIAENDKGYYSIISKDVNIEKSFVQVEFAFDDYFIFTDNNGKCGIINALTQEIEINPKYDYIILIEDTNMLQAVDGVNNFVDIYSKDLDKIVSMTDGIVEKIDDDYTIVYSENDMKYLNKDGKAVKNTDIFKDRKLYAIQKNGKWGFANASGKIVVECNYDIVTELNEYGFAGIKKDGKWGVIDENGKLIVEPAYELDTYYFPKFINKYQLLTYNLTYCQEL